MDAAAYAVLGAAMLAGSIASIAGFGIGSILTPTLSVSYDAKLAVAAVSIPHLIGTALRLWLLGGRVERRVLWGFGIASATGGLVGAMLTSVLDSPWLLTLLALLLLFVSAGELSGLSSRMVFTGWWAWLAGGLSGMLGGLVGNQGGLRAAGLLAFELQPRVFLATSTAVALVVDLARTPVYLVRAGPQLWSLGVPIAVAAMGCLIGTVWGERLLLRIRPETYRRLVGAGVGVIGLWLFARAF